MRLEIEEKFFLIKEVVRVIRNLKAEAGLAPSLAVPVDLVVPGSEDYTLLVANQRYFTLVKLSALVITDTIPESTEKFFSGMAGTVEVRLPLTDLVDLEALRVKLARDLAKKVKQRDSLRTRLEDSSYREKAPEELIQKSEQELAELDQQTAVLEARLSTL
jgi:valyl-tRNA synthetase